MSLRDGKSKMSKSDESDYSRINLKDSPDIIKKKIKKAKTDSKPISESIKDMEKRYEAINLINIYCEVTDSSIEKVLSEMSGKDFSYLKDKLSEALIEKISPIGLKISQLLRDKSYLLEVLNKGKEKADIIAEENIKKIREIVGFV